MHDSMTHQLYMATGQHGLVQILNWNSPLAITRGQCMMPDVSLTTSSRGRGTTTWAGTLWYLDWNLVIPGLEFSGTIITKLLQYDIYVVRFQYFRN